MKILQVPKYISIPNDKRFSRNITGYGLMTLDIAISIAKQGVDVDLMTISSITKNVKYKNINILQHRWLQIILSIHIVDILNSIRIIQKNRLNFIKSLNVLFYNVSKGYFARLIKKKYDCVHFHGIGYSNLPLIEYCIKKKQKFVVTLHGLDSFSESVKISTEEGQLERDFLRKAAKENIPVTVISSGVIRTIIDYLKVPKADNYMIVTNGCKTIVNEKVTIVDIRKKYNISNRKKIALCVGNIVKRKNQIQVVRAYNILPSKTKNNLCILFLGTDVTNGEFESEIAKCDNTNNIISCGNIPKSDMANYYFQADFNIVASINEGFGLSMIESFVYGVPTITFSDLDAIPDLFHKRVMLLVEERTDEAFSMGLKKITERNWNSDFIKDYSKKFSLELMALKYIDIYKQIVL